MRGGFVGLGLRHDRGALARAVLEGVAYALRDGLDLIAATGQRPESARVSGGGARSELWLQILASVLELPLERTESEAGAAYGAALLGGVAAGVFERRAHGRPGRGDDHRQDRPRPSVGGGLRRRPPALPGPLPRPLRAAHMSVSALTALIEPAERVMTEIEAWRPRFERGELRPSISGRPALAPDERFAVDVGRVRAAGLGHPAAGGVLHATDRRAVMFDVGLVPVREWGLTDLAAVSALGNWRGLAIVHADGDTELVVAVDPRLPTWQDAAGWLKVEAAFAAAGGRLSQWVAELPERLMLTGHA